MKNTIKFIAIAILLGVSFSVADAQDATVAVINEGSIKKIEPKTVKKQSSNDDSWTGFYVGGYTGYTNGRSSANTSTEFVANGYFNSFAVENFNKTGRQKLTSNGFSGGGTFGYNLQKGYFLVGGEVDFGANKINKSVVVKGDLPIVIKTFTLAQSTKTDWQMSLRPRLGIVASKKAIFYATGGIALTNIKFEESYTDTFASPIQKNSFSKTKTGWTAGGGIEVKITNRLSAKGEYLFSQFGKTTITNKNLTYPGGGGNGVTPFTSSADLKSHSIRFGINYRF